MTFNAKLSFITTTGQIDHAAIEAAVERRANYLRREYAHRVDLTEADWNHWARDDHMRQAMGERQLFEIRCQNAGVELPEGFYSDLGVA